MLETIPNLVFFSNAYWNQMGSEVYGTIEAAFRHFLADAAQCPDGGETVRRALLGEMILILASDDYGHWLERSRTNRETVNALGGRFILPDEVEGLMAILAEDAAGDA